jgi:ribonuclease R
LRANVRIPKGTKKTRRGVSVRGAFRYSESDMLSLGEHCSMTERRADEATRDAVDWLKCEYMLDKVGENYDGIVSSVTSFGIFVELKEIYVEGLVHITALHNDYYHFDPAGHRLRGERTGRSYRLGDAVRVRVVRVDLDERKMDFELAEAAPADTDKPKRKSRRKSRGGGKNRKRKRS